MKRRVCAHDSRTIGSSRNIRLGRKAAIAIFILLAVTANPAAAADIARHTDLVYYQGEGYDDDKHRLDLYLPESPMGAPMMLWIHGGAWAVGGRKQEAEMARRLAERGVAVAAISYRLSPAEWIRPELDSGVEHPEHLRDIVRALKWVLTQQEQYGYSAEGIFVGGYSAGAHMSALLALDERYLLEAGLGLDDIAGVVPVAGAYDMNAYYESQIEELGPERARSHLFQVFGDKPGILAEVSPTEHLTSSSVAMLVISETDTFDYTLLFEQQAKTAGNENVRFLHVRNRNHRALHEALKRADEPALQAIVDFVKTSRTFPPAGRDGSE